MSTKDEPVDRKQAGEMRTSERGEFVALLRKLLTYENGMTTKAAIEELEKWVDAFGRDRVAAGVEWERERAEPELKASIEDEANSYRLTDNQRETFAAVLDRAINLAKGGYSALAARDGLKKLHDFDAHSLAADAYKAGYRRGVNAVYDDAESGIDRKGFVVLCVGCRVLNHYPGGFTPGLCGNCGEDLSTQPRYREVDRVEDVPVFEPIEEEPEPIARASHHEYNFNGGTGDYALIKLYCQPHQAEKVYAAALELVDRKGEAISGPWYGPGVAKERSDDLFGTAEPAAATAAHDDLRCPVCGSLERDALDDGGAACSACGNQCWPEPFGNARAAAEAEAIQKREHEHKEELNAAYSDGYRTGKMHAGRGARFLAGEDLEAPEAETPLVYVTISKKGRITASGPAPDVLAVLRGVLALEDEEPALTLYFEFEDEPADGATESESERQ